MSDYRKPGIHIAGGDNTPPPAPVRKAPGVYVEEKNAFPNEVVEVATGIPVFLGYTEKAEKEGQDLTGVPTRITSLSATETRVRAFETYFGRGPGLSLSWRRDDAGRDIFKVPGQRFHLYQSMRLFFDNGGGACWIVSLGGYDADSYGAGDVTDAIWQALAHEREPAICLMPDAVALPRAAHKTICERMLAECSRLGSRMAILDLYDGRGPGPDAPAPAHYIDDALNGPDGFRAMAFGDAPSFGAAYYPWLDTSAYRANDVDFRVLDMASRAALAEAVTSEPDHLKDSEKAELIPPLTDPAIASDAAAQLHNALNSSSFVYRDVISGLLAEINSLPPSGAMAGVWAQTDNARGVWKAPANTGIAGALSATIEITDAAQQDLDTPPSGLAVNAIRTFPGRGTLVWGARTLDGNSHEYRYINLRRTLIMLEQSIGGAIEAYIFEPNDENTWQTVRTMIEDFLTNQWKAGAFAGSTPDQAYTVAVGLGTTMTENDIRNGIMRVRVGVALSRPAEFRVMTFQQTMRST
jgi:hypothetical protein